MSSGESVAKKRRGFGSWSSHELCCVAEIQQRLVDREAGEGGLRDRLHPQPAAPGEHPHPAGAEEGPLPRRVREP